MWGFVVVFHIILKEGVQQKPAYKNLDFKSLLD